MTIHTYYQRTDEHGRPTGTLSPTKVVSWLLVPFLAVMWGIYLWHMAHGQSSALSALELGGVSLGGVVLMAVCYFAERRLGELGADVITDRLRNE